MVSSYGNHSHVKDEGKDRRVVNCFQNGIFLWKSQLTNYERVRKGVVNCFQNGIFLWKSQPVYLEDRAHFSCELLSKWYLPMEITATDGEIAKYTEL